MKDEIEDTTQRLKNTSLQISDEKKKKTLSSNIKDIVSSPAKAIKKRALRKRNTEINYSKLGLRRNK